MDNIKIKKIYQDEDLLELDVYACNEYVQVRQTCYIQKSDLISIGNKIIAFSYDYLKPCYVEFGSKIGNFTPAFSLELKDFGKTGRIKIEVDMEINDNENRKHRCQFYVQSELGLIEQFGINLIDFATNENLEEFDLTLTI